MACYFCEGCGWHPCRCWRALDRERQATTDVRRVSWNCSHRVLTSHVEKAHAPATLGQWQFGHRPLNKEQPG